MYGAITFLAVLALAHGRPEIIRSSYPNLWEPSDLCPPIHVHHLIPHESDCSKFYYCEYGHKRIDATNCAPGTLFSYEKQVCVHPWDANCNLPGSAETPAPQTEAPSQPTYPNLWEPSDFCPPIHVHHLIPHESDCSKFYYCEYGMKRIDATNCAPGTLFSYEKQVCVHPFEAECNQPGPNPPVDTPAPPTVAPSQPTYPNLWEPSDLCPPIHEHYLIPHESDCSKFYYCEYGMKRIDATNCAPGTLFSYDKQVCVHPFEADCNQPGPNPPVDTPAPPTVAPSQPTYPNLWEPSDLCPPIHEHHLIPHESDCSKFYYCEYGMKRIDATNCAPGTLFSYEKQVCVHPRDADCDLPATNPPQPPTEVPVTNPPQPPTEVPVTNPPQPPTEVPVTNPPQPPTELPVTNPPQPTTEALSTIPPQPPTEVPVTNPPQPPTEVPVTNPPQPPTEVPVTNPPQPPTDAPVTTPEPDCECEDGGNNCEVDYDARCRDNCNILPWSHATDCDKYWRCEGDKAVRVICPEGLHFNPATASCDYMCNAGCIRRHTTTTTYSDGLKIFVPFSEINGASTGLQSRIQRAIEHTKKP